MEANMPIKFELGQKVALKVKNGTHARKVNGEVVATGGGHTTFRIQGKLVCFTDEEATAAVTQ
jgi:hypothetical protein